MSDQHIEDLGEADGFNGLLEEISVFAPGMWENEDGPVGWWAVCNEEGIIAYFGKEVDAFFFRLALINARLNRIG